jgi:hypothetical protein
MAVASIKALSDRHRDVQIADALNARGVATRRVAWRASTRDCGSCHLKPNCTPNMTFRKIPRDVHEDARDTARAWMGTPEFYKSRDGRNSGHVSPIRL